MLSSEINSLFSVLNYPVAAAVSALALLLVALFQLIMVLVLRRTGGIAHVFEGLRR